MIEELRYIFTHPMLIWGAFGALAPWVFQFTIIRRRRLVAERTSYFLVLILLYVVIGGVLASAFDAANRIVAIYIGASWPANLGFYAGAPTNPGEAGEKLGFRQMLGVTFYRGSSN